MPLSEVSNAVYAYLEPNASNIPNLGTLYQALPKIANESDLFTNTFPGLGIGATIYMFFTAQEEERIALGGAHNGRKFRHYNLGLLIVFKSDLPDTESGQLSYNAFIDALTARIQADRTAGTAPSLQYDGVIFQWGEGSVQAGGPDLQFDHFIPRTLDGGVTLFQSVGHITVCEVLET